MGEPGSTQERYCISYYDKHGLYNDGFPCPEDKYCCQIADGSKLCCDVNAQSGSIRKDDEPGAEETLLRRPIAKLANSSNRNGDQLRNQQSDGSRLFDTLTQPIQPTQPPLTDLRDRVVLSYNRPDSIDNSRNLLASASSSYSSSSAVLPLSFAR